MLVREFMSREVITVEHGDSVALAADLMKKHSIRRLPVMQDGIMVGVVTSSDIGMMQGAGTESFEARQLRSTLESIPVSEVMKGSPATTTPDTPLEDAALVMRRQKVGGLPVLAAEKLVGILTEGNVLDAFCKLLSAGEPGVRLMLQLGVESSTLGAVLDELSAHSPGMVCVLGYPDDPAPGHSMVLKLRDSPTLLGTLTEKLRELRVVVKDSRVVG